MSFDINIFGSGFKLPFQPPPNGNIQCSFQKADLIRAAIVAGHPNLASASNPRIRAWRISGIKLAVQESVGNTLRHPRVWNRLDPTEKGQIRNLLGNTVTKLLCEKILAAPLMVFLDIYGKAFNFRFKGKRPDFIAQRLSGEWLTLEAKGRDRMASLKTLASIKTNQAKAQPTLQPAKIQAHVVSWIGQRWGDVCARLHDPPPLVEDNLPPIDSGRLAATYYRPFLNLVGSMTSSSNILDQTPLLVDDCDFWIAFHPEIANMLQNKKFNDVMPFLTENQWELTTKEYAADGIRIVPGRSWITTETTVDA